MIINILKKAKRLFNHFKYKLSVQYYAIFYNSFSQRHEDILIGKLFNDKKNGFYVDVGANDPIKLNNTYRFYNLGWKGINIEPHKLRYNKLVEIRPLDINLNIGVANEGENLEYYETDPDYYSTFSKKELANYKKDNIKILNTLQIPVQKLSTVLNQHCGRKSIDFLSIDTEGFDLEVLKSNDWIKYKPKIICIEIDKDYEAIRNFLGSFSYIEIYNNGLNSLFTRGIL